MEALLATGGERLRIECQIPWVTRLIEEAAGEHLQHDAADASCTVLVRVEVDHRPFDLRDWEPLTRAAHRRGPEVVMEDACTAGFDLHLRCRADRAEFTYRWRPPARDRLAAWALRARFHLLARAVLAATLAAGTGIGPAHPPVSTVASAFAARLPSFEIVLPGGGGSRLTDLLEPLEAIA